MEYMSSGRPGAIQAQREEGAFLPSILENLGHTAFASDNKCTHVLNMREFCSCFPRFCALTGFDWLINIETLRLPESKVSLERPFGDFLGRL
jgi:hypothetical protein